MLIGSEQFNKRQYEEDRKNNYNSQQEFIRQGIRAVLTMYILRERDPINNSLDILVNDRISEWRTMERVDKFWIFKKFMLINFFIVGVLGAFGVLDSIKGISIYFLILVAISYILQSIKAIFIQGNVGTKYTYQRNGVKRAIRDVWFETIISVHISYFIATAINLLLWLLCVTIFADTAIYVMQWFVNLSDYLGDSASPESTSEQLLTIYFIANLIFIWTDYLYWKLIYSRNIPLLPFEHEDKEQIDIDENDIYLNDEDDEYSNKENMYEENVDDIPEEDNDDHEYIEVKKSSKKTKVKKYLTEVKRGRE